MDDLDEEDKRLLKEYPRAVIAVGLYHTIALSKKGDVYAWGGNGNGQLGIGSMEQHRKKYTVAQLRVALRRHAQRRVGAGVSKLAMTYTDERIKAMGMVELKTVLQELDPAHFNFAEQATLPPREDQATPVLVKFPFKISESQRILEVACGLKHSLALDTKGHVYSWGSGANGKLGHGDEYDKHKPTLVEALSRKRTIRICCGSDCSGCLTDSGEIYTFGVGRYGNLGHGTNVSVKVPTVVDALIGNKMIYLSMGSKHTIAIQQSPEPRGSNVVWAWGNGADGRLGTLDGNGEFRPIRVDSLRNENVVLVAAGEAHSLALNNRGTVWSWGGGEYGKLGHGDTANVSSPKIVEELRHTKVKNLSVGAFHSLVLTSTGLVYSWGGGSYGKLGHGESMNQIIPRHIEKIENVVALAAGSFHSAFVTSVGNLYLCGYGGNGRLGNGNNASSNYPDQVRSLKNEILVDSTKTEVLTSKQGMTLSDIIQPRELIRMYGGGFHSVGLTDQGMIFAFGDGKYGQLGINLDHLKRHEKREKLEPKFVPGISNAKFVACGTNHTLVITKDGKMASFGRGAGGVLGHGDATDQPEPRLIRTLAYKNVVQCATAEMHCAACTDEGECFTWGSGDFGKLGHGELNDETTPRLVAALDGKKVIQVACGFSHTLALISGSLDVYAWGSGHGGKLGLGDEQNRSEPTLIQAMKRRGTSSLACGALFSLALSQKGLVYSFGANESGQCGRKIFREFEPDIIDELRSVKIIKIATGEAHALALSDKNELFSWGSNNYGQLGHGSRDTETIPKRVDTLLDCVIKDVACGANHSLVLSQDGELFVWGNGANGRLGLNTIESRLTPTHCPNMASALKETGTIGPQMLSDLQDTKMPIERMTDYLSKGRAISQRVQDKLNANEPVDMKEEMDGLGVGQDENMRENIVLVKAAAIASGAEPASLMSLQQLVKTEHSDVRLELEEEQAKIEALRAELDKFVIKNNQIEMNTILMNFKIGNVLKNQLQLQMKLSAAQGYVLNTLKVVNDPDEEILTLPMEQYSQMLAICYEKPSVLMALAESIPEDSTKERERFWNLILFTLYGDQTNARDEFNLLTLAHQLFTERSSKVAKAEDLLELNENVGLLVQTYMSRKACLRATKLILEPVVNEVLERGQRLELDPVKIYHKLHPTAEGLGDLNFNSSITDPAVKELYQTNIAVVTHLVDQFIKRVTSTHATIPYGVRWIAKRLDEIADEKIAPSSAKSWQRASLVSRFIFSRLLNHGIITPELFDICQEPPSKDIKANLVLIMEVLDRVVQGRNYQRTGEEEHMAPLNKLIRTSQDLLEAFADQVTSVKSLELHNRESRYLQTLSSLTPNIAISINGIDFLHRLIDQGFRNNHIPGDRKQWMKILTRAGIVHGDVEEHLNHLINIRIRLSDRIIWPEMGQAAELLEDNDIKTQLLLALQELPLLPLSVSGTLEDNLVNAKKEASEREAFSPAHKLQEVILHVRSNLTAVPAKDKEWCDQFLRDSALQVKKLARMRTILKNEYKTLTDMEAELKRHGTNLQLQLDRSRQYLNNVKQTKIQAKHLQLAKRKKIKKGEYIRPEVRQKREQIESSLLVKSVLKDEHRNLMSNDLRQFVEARLEVLRKMQLAEEVDLNPDWQQQFEDNPKLMVLIGRTPKLESLVKQDKEVAALLELQPEFADQLYGNPDLTPTELQDFFLENPELHDFVMENDNLKTILESRAKQHLKTKAINENAMGEIEMGPMYTLKFDKALKQGIVVTMEYPEKILRRVMLQFSSPLRGQIDILAYDRKTKRAIAMFQLTKEQLIDCQGSDKKYFDLQKAKFHVGHLLTFIDTHLRW